MKQGNVLNVDENHSIYKLCFLFMKLVKIKTLQFGFRRPLLSVIGRIFP